MEFHQTKRRRKNLKLALSYAEEQTRLQISKITASDIRKYSKHSRKEEKKYMDLARLVDLNK